MNIVKTIEKRSLGFGIKIDANLIDLRIDTLRRNSLHHDTEAAVMSTAFDHSDTCDNVRLAGFHDNGSITLFTLGSNHEALSQNSFRAHNDCIHDGVWSLDGKHLFTACSDGTVGHICVERRTPIQSTMAHVNYFKSMMFSQKCIVLKPDDPNVFITGSSEGYICVWDTRTKSAPDFIIRKAHSEDFSDSKKRRYESKSRTIFGSFPIRSSPIRSIVFQDSNRFISSCSATSLIKIWDLRRTYYCSGGSIPKPICCMCAPKPVSGYSSLALDTSRMRLYARAQNSTIQIFDVASCKKEPVSQIVEPLEFQSSSFDVKIKLSPDCRHLVTGSTTGCLKIWNTKSEQLIFDKDGDTDMNNELTGVDWVLTKNKKNLICGGLDEGQMCVWNETDIVDLSLLEDPPSLHCKLSQLQIERKPIRPKTPPPLQINKNDIYESPTLNLPNFVEDSSSHPVTKISSAQKSRTPNSNWLENLRKEITPKRSTMTTGIDSNEKNKSGKKSRRRLNSSPGMALTDFLQQHCKIPRLDNERSGTQISYSAIESLQTDSS